MQVAEVSPEGHVVISSTSHQHISLFSLGPVLLLSLHAGPTGKTCVERLTRMADMYEAHVLYQ